MSKRPASPTREPVKGVEWSEIKAAHAAFPSMDQGIDLDELPNRVPSGAYGYVLFGTDRTSDQRVAVKVTKSADNIDLAKLEARKLDNIRKLAASHKPPHCTVFRSEAVSVAVGYPKGWHYLVMDKIDGEELFDALERRGAFTEQKAAAPVSDILIALLFLHSAGTMHLDIKVENMNLGPDGHATLLDFGLSRRKVPNRKLIGKMGSRSYMPPEMHGETSGGYDGCIADVWSFGVTLFVLVCGFFPFADANACDPRFLAAVDAQKLGQSTTKAIFDYYGQTPNHLSPDLIILIDALLTVDASTRPSIRKALELALKWLDGLSSAQDMAVAVRAALQAYDDAHSAPGASAEAAASAVAGAVAPGAPGPTYAALAAPPPPSAEEVAAQVAKENEVFAAVARASSEPVFRSAARMPTTTAPQPRDRAATAGPNFRSLAAPAATAAVAPKKLEMPRLGERQDAFIML